MGREIYAYISIFVVWTTNFKYGSGQENDVQNYKVFPT